MEPLSPIIVKRLIREMEGYFELGLFDDVVTRANQLLDANDANVTALRWKGRALQQSEHWARAIEAFERLRDLDPDGDDAFLGLGWCQKRSGRLDRALAELETLVSRHPEHALAVYNLSCYCALDGQHDRSLDLLRSAVSIDHGFRDHAQTESDFDSVRDRPEFSSIVGEV